MNNKYFSQGMVYAKQADKELAYADGIVGMELLV